MSTIETRTTIKRNEVDGFGLRPIPTEIIHNRIYQDDRVERMTEDDYAELHRGATGFDVSQSGTAFHYPDQPEPFVTQAGTLCIPVGIGDAQGTYRFMS